MKGRDLDVLVIGSGQAGLAMGYYLKRAGYRFQIVERNPRLGDSWRNRYDSLVLFTPRAYSALPGLPLPGDPNCYPTKDEMADYLERYASYFDLPVLMETGIRSLTCLNGGFRARTDAGELFDARAVVLATGAFQRSAIPRDLATAFAGRPAVDSGDLQAPRPGPVREGIGRGSRGNRQADSRGARSHARGTSRYRPAQTGESGADIGQERLLVDG
jgi:putative flavoprotein involved in K+ transport